MFRRTRTHTRQTTNRINASRLFKRPRLWLQNLEERTVPAAFLVNDVNDTGAGSGTSGDLRFCLAAAGATPEADTITFDTAGVFAAAQTIYLTGTLNVPGNVKITGTGAASLTIDALGSGRVFNVTGAAGTLVTFEKMTITGGNATNGYGAGINLGTANVTINDSIVTGNTNTSVGGALGAPGTSGTITLTNTQLTNNNASEGAGIYFFSGGTLFMTNCTVSSNLASANSGGLYLYLVTATIISSTFDSNSGTMGGGIDNRNGGNVTIIDSTFSNNTATGTTGGGGIRIGSGTVTISGSTFDSNNAFAGPGGGILMSGTSLTLKNSTLNNNSAGTNGGGISQTAGTATIANSTIAGNYANAGGGGINRSAGTLNLTGTIVGDNVDAGFTGPDIFGTVASNAFDLFGDLTGITFTGGQAPTTIVGAPALGALANNGGLTKTMLPNAGSPAINAGANLYPNTSRFDQRGPGYTRSFGVTDIGAAELVTAGFPSAAVNAVDMTVLAPTYIFTVDYYDDVAVNVGSIDGADVTVTGGPGTFSSISLLGTSGTGTKVTATYAATPSVAITGAAYNGIYTVNMVGGQVSDGTNSVPAGANTQFKINVPASYQVNRLLDETVDTDGGLSLREAIGLANLSTATMDTITFDPTVFTAGTIYTLTKGVGTITDSLVITGPGAANITIDAANTNQALTVNAGLTVTASGLTFTNFAGTGVGGVLTNAGADVSLTDIKFINNKTSSTTGGGVIGLTAANAKVTLTNCVLTGNSVTGSGGDGGIIRGTTNSFVTMVNCTVSGNTANDDGGAIYLTGASLNVTGSTFSANSTGTTTTSDGGAILYTGTVGASGFNIRNSTFSGNTAGGSGGAIQLAAAAASILSISNSTFTGNQTNKNVAGFGGAISRQTGTLNLESNIVSGNTLFTGTPAANGPDVFTAAANTFKFNAVGTSTGFPATLPDNTNFIGTPVALGALANNGGATLTHLPASGSPTRNNGSNPGGLATDQAGAPRTSQLFTDIGAVESVDVAPVFHMTPINAVLVGGATPNQVVITYSDDNLIDFTSIKTSNIEIVAPDASKLAITGVSVDVSADGPNRIATYTFTPPGGTWDGPDNGNYKVNILGSQVADKDGTVHYAAANNAGNFQVGVPANFVVDNTGDVDDGDYSAGKFTLREAIARANILAVSPDTITFGGAAFASAATITLVAALPTIAGNLTITGNGSSSLTISGNNLFRIFTVSDATQVAVVNLNSVRLANGKSGAGGGGAILNSTGETINISKSLIENNTADSGNGGVISLPQGGALTIASSTFNNNATVAGPGGVLDGNANNGTLTITDSTFTGNKAPGNRGGVISLANFVTTISRSTFSGNTAGNGGAISFYSTSTVTLDNVTISSNTATTSGGGIQVQSGGVSSLAIRNSTITANTANTSGGGIAVTSGTWTPNLYSTIVYGNLNATSPDLFSTLTVNADYSIIGDPTGVTTFNQTNSPPIGTNPLLGPLQNNGGPTLTHALTPGSPAVDAGDNALGSYLYDQRGPGFPRVLNGKADIGAFEGVDAAPQAMWTPFGPITSPGATPNTIDVIWSDDVAINVGTIGTNDITIKAPNGTLLTITGAMANPNTNGTPIVVTYTFTVPGGAWGNTVDSGVYTVSTVAGAVADTGGSTNKATSLGTFLVDLPANYVVDEATDVADGDFSAGHFSLREALSVSNSTTSIDTISFSPTVFGTAKSIVVGSAMAITEPVFINAPAAMLTLNGMGGTSRAFSIDLNIAGGAVSMAGLTLTNFTVTGNGGAIDDQDAMLTLTSMVFSKNTASTNGGAVNLQLIDATLTVSNCVFAQNTATSGDGGALFVLPATTIAIDTSAIQNNIALGTSGDGGAIMLSGGGMLTIDNSTVSGNTANNTSSAFGGGAIYGNNAVSMTMTSSTFSGNKASGGGGAIHLDDNGTLNLYNCTIVNNTSTFNGGGINLRVTGATANISSTIIAGNSGAVGPDIFGPSGSTVNMDTSDLGNTAGITNLVETGVNLLNTDPLIGPLAANGGFLLPDGSTIQTRVLTVGSPALDQGSNPLGLTNDQRGAGFARVLNGTADIGAVEGLLTNPTGKFNGLATITVPGPTPNTLTVTYSDDVAVKVSTIDVNDITITAPDGLTKLAITNAAVDINTDGTPRTVTYTFTPPGGAWDQLDNGKYTIDLVANQISDTSGSFAFAGTLGTFSAGIAANYVVDEATDVNDGVFTAGKLSLREAMVLANGDAFSIDTISFSPAVFNAAKTLSIVNGEMKVSGPVVISGPAARLTLDGGGLAGRAFNINTANVGDAVSITGLTISNFNFTGSGGAINNENASLTLTNMVLSKNTASTNGGAVYLNATGSSLTAVNCVFADNVATGGDGGAIYVLPIGTVAISKSVIRDNVALSTSGDGGGIMMSGGGTLTVDNSTISGNIGNNTSAAFGGGGVYGNAAITMTFNNSTVSGNKTGGGGGGIHVDDNGTVNINNSTIVNNTAAFAGGGINLRVTGGTANIVSSIVAGNLGATAPDINGPTGSTVNVDSTIIGNSANITTLNQTGTNFIDVDPLVGPLANNGGPTFADGSAMLTHALLVGSPAIDAGSNTLALPTDQRGQARLFDNLAISNVTDGTDIGAFEAQPSPPAKLVAGGIVINGGQADLAQRSRVTSLTVTFDSAVSFTDITKAFKLDRVSPGGGSVTLNTVMNGTNTVATITFTGGSVNGASLADGRYALTLVANQFGGAGFDGNNDGTAGDDYTSPSAVNSPPTTAPTGIFRLYGDIDGNGQVNGGDFLQFRLKFLQNYSPFDFDQSGLVDGADFLQFRLRFLQNVT